MSSPKKLTSSSPMQLKEPPQNGGASAAGDVHVIRNIKKGALNTAKATMKSGLENRQEMNIFARDSKGDTVIHACADKGDQDILDLIMSCNPNAVNLKDEDGNLPVHRAALLGHAVFVQKLVKLGSPVNAKNNKGETPFQLAIKKSKVEVIDAMMNLPGVQVSSQQLSLCHKDTIRLTKQLIKAAETGDEVLAQSALEQKADPNAKEIYGVHAVHKAAAKGHAHILELLFLHKCDLNAKDHAGEAPLHYAARSSARCVDLLIQLKADIRSKDHDFFMPLHYAASSGIGGCVETLLAAGAPIHAKNRTGATPLHQAAANGKLRVLEALITSKADVNALDTMGEPATFWAARRGHLQSLFLLLEHKARLDVKDVQHNTLLHVAARHGQWHTCDVLLSAADPAFAQHQRNRIDINGRDVKGEAAIEIAKKAIMTVPEPPNVQEPSQKEVQEMQDKATDEKPYVEPKIVYYPSGRETVRTLERHVLLAQGYIIMNGKLVSPAAVKKAKATSTRKSLSEADEGE